jgi:hypothetical protein
MYLLNSNSELKVSPIRLFEPNHEDLSSLGDTTYYFIMAQLKEAYPPLVESHLPTLGKALVWDPGSWGEGDLIRNPEGHMVPRTQLKIMADIAIDFSRLKKEEEILLFAKNNGLLGCSLIHPETWNHHLFSYNQFHYVRSAQSFYEPLIFWQWHIDHVRTLLKWYNQLLEEPIPSLRDQLISRLEWFLRDGIKVTTGNVEINHSRLGFVIKESRVTSFLLSAIYYDIWRLLTDERPIKTCKICGNPFSSKRKDAVVCGKGCQKRLDRSRAKGDDEE